MPVEVHFDAVDVEAFEQFGDDRVHVFADGGIGVVLACSDVPVDRSLWDVFVWSSDEEVWVFLSEFAVFWGVGFCVGRHEVGVVAVHANAGDELDACFAAEGGDHGDWPFCGFHEAADVLRLPSRVFLEFG